MTVIAICRECHHPRDHHGRTRCRTPGTMGPNGCPCTTFILTIPYSVDQELLAIAEKAAGRRPDAILAAMGWTRFEYVDAIHNRLRAKWREMRAGK